MMRRDVPGFEVAHGHLVIVPLQEAIEDLGQVAPLGPAKPADNPEVHRGQP